MRMAKSIQMIMTHTKTKHNTPILNYWTNWRSFSNKLLMKMNNNVLST